MFLHHPGELQPIRGQKWWRRDHLWASPASIFSEYALLWNFGSYFIILDNIKFVSLSNFPFLFRLTLKTNWDGSADGGFSLDFCQPGGHRFVHRFQIEITHKNVFSNSSHFHDISARGFTATEIVAIQRFARTLRDYPFLITSGSWVDFALVLVRLRTRTSGRLGAPVWVPRTVPLWRTATHGPTGYHHNVQNISNLHLNCFSCVHDFKNPRIFTFLLIIQMFVF